jgi:hypothetical protein
MKGQDLDRRVCRVGDPSRAGDAARVPDNGKTGRVQGVGADAVSSAVSYTRPFQQRSTRCPWAR